MEQPQLLYTILSICAVIITAITIYIVYLVASTIRSINKLLDNVKEAASDITSIKNSMRKGATGIVATVLGKIADSLENK